MAQQAPGKAHRKGITLAELFHRFPDDATAERWFAQQRWPEGLHCPYCGSTNAQSGAKHKTMPYRCREKECAKRFSVRTKTPMESSKLGFQVWAIALYQVTTNLKGVSSMKLHRDLGITQRSAWFLAHRLREAWDDHGSMYPGPVEVDETYIGGKRKNMPHSKRKELKGRGAVGKAVVIGLRVERSIDADATGVRGQPGRLSAYKGMPFHHEAAVGEYGEWLNRAMLKRGYQGWTLYQRRWAPQQVTLIPST